MSRILTTHVGSLIRPDDLREFLLKQQNGEPYDEKAFAACLERSVAEVVRKQAEVGIDLVSDGEFGKTISWSRYIVERLDGIEERFGEADTFVAAVVGKDRRDFKEFYEEYESQHGFVGMGTVQKKAGTWHITGPIKYSGSAAIQRDIAAFKKAIAGQKVVNAFLPVVAPASVLPHRKDHYYKREEEALFAFADALHEEYKAITDAGLICQIDDAFLASHYDTMVPPASLVDYRKWADLRVAALNHAVRGLPEERLRYHLCWGSWNGPHTNDVAMKDIVDLMLKVKVGGYAIEMANPRHAHEWKVWETVKLPPGRKLIPGVVAHSTTSSSTRSSSPSAWCGWPSWSAATT
jgi:5-methyltetrahydropteroyltriglutamate--homocysteine methyltransferase